MRKQATSTTVYKSDPHVVKDFVTALATACPSKLMAEVFDDLVQGVAAEEASVVAVAGVLPLYEVDATGKVKDPLALLREKGFDIGAVAWKSGRSRLRPNWWRSTPVGQRPARTSR